MSKIAISDTATSEYAVEISQDAAGNQIVKRYTATELRNMTGADTENLVSQIAAVSGESVERVRDRLIECVRKRGTSRD